MKTAFLLSHLFLLLFFSVVGCNKKNAAVGPISELRGEWVNINNEEDKLFFQNDVIIRTNLLVKGLDHRYEFTVKNDSLLLRYTGVVLIDTPETLHRYVLDRENGLLTIEGFSGLIPKYEGDIFKRTK